MNAWKLPITYEDLGLLKIDRTMWLKILANSPLLVPWYVENILQNKSWDLLLKDDSINTENNPTILDFTTYNQLPDEFKTCSLNEKKQLISLIISNWNTNSITPKIFKNVKELYYNSINYLVEIFHINWKALKRFNDLEFSNINDFIKFIENNPFKNSISWNFLHCSIIKMMLLLNIIRSNINFVDLNKVINYIKKSILEIDWFDVIWKQDNNITLNISFIWKNNENKSCTAEILFDKVIKTEKSIIYKLLAKRQYMTVDALKDLVRFKVKIDDTWNYLEMQEYYSKIMELIIEKIFIWEIEVQQNYTNNPLIDNKYFEDKNYKYDSGQRNIENINITWIPNINEKVKWLEFIEAQIVSSKNTNDEKWIDSRPFYEWIDKILIWMTRLLNFWVATMWNIKYAIKEIVQICKEKWIWDYDELYVLSILFTRKNIFPINVLKMNWKWKWTIVFWIKWAYNDKLLKELYPNLPVELKDISWDMIKKIYLKTHI
jgi:hypothetical protein